jgi:hypothetical protein
MLPLGHIGIRAERGDDRMSRLTRDEQYTLMTLFAIFRSPLMFGGDLPGNDAFTLSLLTNKDVLAVSKSSFNNRELFADKDLIAWTADDPGTGDKFLALFNAVDPVELCREKALWSSGVITRQTPGQQVAFDLELSGSEKLFLAVGNGGDNIEWDHADWIEPVLISDTDTLRLTSLHWKKATAGWGEARVNKSVSGGDLIVNHVETADGIGTHSNSIIEFDIPSGTKRFKGSAGLDNACIVQNTGATVEFMVFTQDPSGPVPADSAKISVRFSQLGLVGEYAVKDLWTGENLGIFRDEFSRILRRHASGLYRLSKK